MPTPAERQALLFIAAVAALGVGVRAWRSIGRAEPPVGDRAALAVQLARVDSAVTVGGVRRARPGGRSASSGPAASRRDGGAVRERPSVVRPDSPAIPPPLSTSDPPAPVDLDVATAEEIERLPGIGPALAARIVADREANGPFGSSAGLDRVKGVGPALLTRLGPHVTFSLAPRHHDAGPRARGGGGRP